MRETVTERAHGTDVSHWQEEFILAKTWGQIDFAIAKIGEGYNSPYTPKADGSLDSFLRLWDEGCAQVPLRGVYFYQRSGYSWLQQAETVLEAVERLDVKPHFIANDVEKINNTVDRAFLADSLRIMDYWKDEGQIAVNYTNKDVLQNYIQPLGLKYYGQSWLDRVYSYPLWYAQYWFQWSPNKQPGMPTFKPDWTLWQYTDAGDSFEMRDGVRMRHYGSPDLNVYNGTVEDMRLWLNPQDTETPPPTDELPGDFAAGVEVGYQKGVQAAQAAMNEAVEGLRK